MISECGSSLGLSWESELFISTLCTTPFAPPRMSQSLSQPIILNGITGTHNASPTSAIPSGHFSDHVQWNRTRAHMFVRRSPDCWSHRCSCESSLHPTHRIQLEATNMGLGLVEIRWHTTVELLLSLSQQSRQLHACCFL